MTVPLAGIAQFGGAVRGYRELFAAFAIAVPVTTREAVNQAVYFSLSQKSWPMPQYHKI
jgi:hypothetical protein